MIVTRAIFDQAKAAVPGAILMFEMAPIDDTDGRRTYESYETDAGIISAMSGQPVIANGQPGFRPGGEGGGKTVVRFNSQELSAFLSTLVRYGWRAAICEAREPTIAAGIAGSEFRVCHTRTVKRFATFKAPNSQHAIEQAQEVDENESDWEGWEVDDSDRGSFAVVE